MFLYITFQLMPVLLAGGAAQYMQQMPQQPFPYPYQSQQQPMMQMPQQLVNSLPGAMQPGMPQPMMPNLPHLPGMPQPMHPPISFPMQLPLNGGRLPMVVMPQRTKKKDKKKPKSKGKPKKSKKRNHKRRKSHSSSSDESCSSDSGYDHRSKKKRSLRNRHEVLTPVVSYLTKDGYVVYQKKIKKDRARDWLELSKGKSDEYEKKSKNHD